MAINKPTAIQWKYNIQCAEVNGVLKDFSSPLTEEQINTAVSEYETYLNSTEYKRDRAIAYKELKEQFDLLYHDMVADKGDKTGEWFKHIKAVKDANPKE